MICAASSIPHILPVAGVAMATTTPQVDAADLAPADADRGRTAAIEIVRAKDLARGGPGTLDFGGIAGGEKLRDRVPQQGFLFFLGDDCSVHRVPGANGDYRAVRARVEILRHRVVPLSYQAAQMGNRRDGLLTNARARSRGTRGNTTRCRHS